MKPSVRPLIPSSAFIWLLPIVNAAAVVKPTVTFNLEKKNEEFLYNLSAIFFKIKYFSFVCFPKRLIYLQATK